MSVEGIVSCAENIKTMLQYKCWLVGECLTFFAVLEIY
jgi:hypothetical protein